MGRKQHKRILKKWSYSSLCFCRLFFLVVFVEVTAKKRYNISYEIMQFLQYRSANTQNAYMVMCIAERI